MENYAMTGLPSMDRPWMKYYDTAKIPTEIPEINIYHYLKKNSCAGGLDSNDTALSYFGRRISFKELFKHIDNTAKAFSAQGVKQGDIVTLALPNIPENIYCVYALAKLGAVANMVDLRSKGDELKDLLLSTNSRVLVACSLFADSAFAAVLGSAVDSLVLVTPFQSMPAPLRFVLNLKKVKGRYLSWSEFINRGAGRSKAEGYSEVACIFYTSGTTGKPKGIQLTHKNFNAMAIQYNCSGTPFVPRDIVLNQVPAFLAYNMAFTVHFSLSVHMSITMLPDYRPDKFAANIIKYKPNHATAGPADWKNFLNNHCVKGKDLSFLKSPASGSDSIEINEKKAINKLLYEHGCDYPVLEGYGMTEVGSAACSNLHHHDIAGTMGIPLPLTNVCIYDRESAQELGYNETGEICFSGPTVMKGYYNRPEATAEVLFPHADGRLWMHSGDLGFMDEDGNLHLVGRIKRIIIRHDGQKVSPFKIEEALRSNENVSGCCVVGHPDTEHGNGFVPVAYVVLSAPVEDGVAKLAELCKTKLKDLYQPQRIEIISELPRTPNGKVDYRALEALGNKR